MIWLLGEMVVTLLLAAIAGWYIGWTMRGFRDGERVEDLRRTLRATEEVKDRELAEANRRADKAAERNERLQQENERLVTRLEAEAPGLRGGAQPLESEAHGDDRGTGGVALATRPADTSDLVETAAIGPDEVSPGGLESEASEDDDTSPVALRLEERLAEARAQAQDRERALRDKTAAVLALQAELARLREAAETRATEMARLEQRLVELEPLEEGRSEGDEAVASARAMLHELERERDRARDRVLELEQEVERLGEQVDRRDVRINELRVRYQNTAARLEEVQAAARGLGESSDSHAADPDGLAEVRRRLQRQIERNRKQDAVHRQVVSSLQQQVADLKEQLRSQPKVADAGTEVARWQQLLAERDSRIVGLRRRIVEMEQSEDTGQPRRRDDLQKIYGIGPKLARRLEELGVHNFAQIAAWTQDDVERISDEIGDQTGRIRRDDWVRSARALLLGED